MSLSGSRFGGEDPGPKPTSALSGLFEEEPVGLQTFIQDRKFLNADWMLSPLQQELVHVVERVYLKDMYPLLAEEFGGYWAERRDEPMKNLITAQWGKGGGKDSTVRVASLRVAYLLLCLKSPQTYFGIPADDSIHLLNIAVNAAQAQRAFFDPLVKMTSKGWFKDKAEPKRDSIVYDKNIYAISGHSDAESQEGLNILLGVADEIDAFKAKGEMVGQGNRAREASTSAESILNMLKSSASTRFPSNYKRVAISYPRYLGSTIQNLTVEAKQDIEEVGNPVSIYFASGPYATWDVNPRIKGPEDYASDYRKDPDEAAAKYECKPTRATDAYFRNPIHFRQAVTSAEQPLSISYKVVTTPSLQDADKRIRGWEPILTFAEGFKPVAGARYAIHADLAIKGDRAGVAMSHIERWEERDLTSVDETGYVEHQQTVVPIIRNDFTIAFEADISALDPLGEKDFETGKPSVLPREIQIRWVRDLVYELIKRDFFIGTVTYDGFQSVDSMQTLERHGIVTDRVSTDRDPDIWKNLKDVASEARLSMPYSALLLTELDGLSRLNGKVDHLPGASKDLADAFACSIVGAILLGGEEDHEEGSLFVGGDDGSGVENFILGGQADSMFGLDQGVITSGALELPFGMHSMEGGGSHYGW